MKKEPTDIKPLLNFLNESPTAWHAVVNARALLHKAGFKELKEEENWHLKSGECYYVTRHDSSLCAFAVPKKVPEVVHLAASHTDSPGFKLKPKAEFHKHNLIMLGLEVYGAPLITSWLNRDLGLAGRIVYSDDKNNVQHALVRLDKYPVVIPQLAIHLDRKANEDGVLLNKQEQLAAIAAFSEDFPQPTGYLEQLLKEQVPFKQLLDFDLFLFPVEPAALIGFRQQMIASYRIDSLMSVHAILSAISHIDVKEAHVLKMAIFWDNEEIGSDTAQGASSPFFTQILERITLALKMEREQYLRLFSKSLCLSVDLAHATHPNYSNKHDPQHAILMKHGIVIKSNAQQKYASDAHSASVVAKLCHDNKLLMQRFVSRGDIASGSTIGPILAQQTGIPTVDIGTPQLSMHSARELAACQDYFDMRFLIEKFYS